MFNSEKIEQEIGYVFRDKDLLRLAFTHSSYANERRDSRLAHNERLEFLGDAVLELAISQTIYRKYPEMPEGELSKLRSSVVCEPTLAAHARSLHFGEFLLLGRGEEHTGGRERDSMLADAFEAGIGAIFLDGGPEVANAYVLRLLENEVVSRRESFRRMDGKSALQEYIQKSSKTPLAYAILEERGPDHDKTFVAEVRHRGEALGRGEGHSKKEAEQAAALAALHKLGQL